ncbi:hypothetical protein K504DRAFT_262002 [Pleomassaria siparia CBS 279.74]|uniref:Rho-GAP domain-containing protein n=1 Tax=Pleomassaria siparia CBS 279.74 TaxID=1314801 RepID=A0A6G1KC97_9PLEO|nr:hypothetical protein K504DRAFT_262002 [Pleomassaria siparia CBS 279.74]
MPKSSSLSLAMRPKEGKEIVASPTSPRSPGSPDAVYGSSSETATPTAARHNLTETPTSPKVRKDSKNMFSNFSANKPSSRMMNQGQSGRSGSDHNIQRPFYTNGGHGGSTPELNRPIQTANSEEDRSDPERRPGPGNSNAMSEPNLDNSRHAAKPKKQGMLGRSKSIKLEDSSGTRSKLNKPPPKLSPDPAATWNSGGEPIPLKTAPLEKGQSWRQNISFRPLRTQSADRHDGSPNSFREEDPAARKDKTEQSSLASGSFNESRGAALMSTLGSGARKMGDKMDSARKGIFGKLGRSSSNHERDLQIPKEQYQFTVIHTPLVDQTRLTRISHRLEDSKDKTEFWMPALPWRCIDYLNMRGCEEEGLYRVPGAAHQVKYYEQKFDQDDNLNDPNVIGSLFKNWLRNLPDEIFPKTVQGRIQQECQGAKSTPQMLKDELSKLPPFNYYLLFAITCHISLLHSCSEFNKMNYNNLCICFQPAIKIDAFCFQFLILDWRNCWQGCWTEKEYLVEEVRLLEAKEAAQAQAQAQAQPPPTRNGHSTHNSNKSKGSQAVSTHLGDAIKKSSARNNSGDRSKSSGRAMSNDRKGTSGRATPPNNPAFLYSSDTSNGARRKMPSEREPSTDRSIGMSENRKAPDAPGTPKRAPPSLSTSTLADDEDNNATPTQAQHNRAGSESQFRLDLHNPPSSPFSIKF